MRIVSVVAVFLIAADLRSPPRLRCRAQSLTCYTTNTVPDTAGTYTLSGCGPSKCIGSCSYCRAYCPSCSKCNSNTTGSCCSSYTYCCSVLYTYIEIEPGGTDRTVVISGGYVNGIGSSGPGSFANLTISFTDGASLSVGWAGCGGRLQFVLQHRCRELDRVRIGVKYNVRRLLLH